MRRRSRGLYEFVTPPTDLRMMPARFRTLVDQGRVTEAMQPINDALYALGYGNYLPDYSIMYKDLSPAARQHSSWEMEIQNPWHREHWLTERFEAFNYRILRAAERVGEHFGMAYIKEHYCPVCWGRPQMVSEKEIAEKIGYIASQAGSEYYPSITLYNIAITDESYKKYRMRMPVVWMRYSYLRRFKTGQDLINVYRMMRGSEKVYDIPKFPYDGVPDNLL